MTDVVPWCELVGIQIENLRGFRQASLSLERPLTLLVGPNNSGKTSLLRLLHWALTDLDDDLLLGRRQLSDAERSLLVPARETRGSARRLTLMVRIPDGRRARRFDLDRGLVRLRLKVIGNGVFAAVSRPRRSEPQMSEPLALRLLGEVRAAARVVMIPAARDAASDRFRRTLALAIRLRLEERGLHQRRGGAPTEYRTIRKALEAIDGVAEELVGEFWSELAPTLVPGLASAGRISFDSSPQALVDWLVQQAQFAISTGQHDERMVEPSEVGAGLQSLLDLALLEAVQGQSNAWLLLEEPEAFLHPSAQRALATQLFRTRPVNRIISTHSPVIIDEAKYGEVVLLRDHRIYEPSVVEDRREEINSALLTQAGAEAIYSRSVLLVEGPGDRAYFETLRRRLAAHDDAGITSDLGVVAVGGKTRFGPWTTLLQSYADSRSGDAPITWLAVADSIDASANLLAGVRAAGVVVPTDVRSAATRVNEAFALGDEEAGIRHTRELNELTLVRGVPLAMLPIDLEYAALQLASHATIRKFAAELGPSPLSRTDLLRRLGSKSGLGPSADRVKSEWLRGRIAQLTPWSQLPDDVLGVLRRWLSPTATPDQVSSMFARVR